MHLVQICNALLREYGIGDAPDSQVPEDLLTRYALDAEDLAQETAAFMEACADLDPGFNSVA